ncbi:butyrophilin subfamily 1 member A1-like isoform X3 [Pelodiscus sinensis]|uniref:butyrophilin subfamily 1 member A1-like isoform X3 n=1 Tax=Pelodiscus sinensis TaxID=13735 RepID=UPI003F6CB8D8
MTGKVPSCSRRSSESLALPGYLTLCLALQAPRLGSAQFRVTGPDRPVTAPLGGEAVLPCHLSPRMSAENMEVRWYRSLFSAVVHLYRDGQDQYGDQIPEYRGRTELLKDDMASGRVSLRIRDVRPSDDGKYNCLFESQVFFEEALLELQVAGLGSAPDISVEGRQDGGIRVVCRSSGWYPEPQVLWRDLQGQPLPTASEKITPEAGGLFRAEIAMVITEESNQKVSCCVRNPRVNQERESAIFITVDVTLDPDTAHANLVLSADGKTVTYEDRQQDRPDNPERFRTYPVVLGASVFTGGRFYWEVEMGDKTNWTVGVCREPVIRTGKVKLTPENGYWTVWLRHGKYEACTFPPTPFPQGVRPRRVGIFLDYEAGEVSFYSVTCGSHLFTFTETFSGTLRPYFYTGYRVGGKNAAPLVICPVPDQSGEHHGP